MWEDSDEIAYTLNENYPDIDPLDLSFPKLHRMIVELQGFDDKPENVNEKKLEAIQMAWYELKK